MVEHIKREHPLAERPPHTNAPPMARPMPRIPRMKWSDTLRMVMMTVCSPENENTLDFHTTSTELHFICGDASNTVKVPLFAPIDETQTTVDTLPNGKQRVCLVKERRGRWPYLFKDNRYRGQTTVDWQNWIAEDDEEDRHDFSFVCLRLDVTAFQRVLQQSTQSTLGQQAPKGIEPTQLPNHTLTEVTGDMTDDKCPICLENFKLGETVRVLKCKHFSHQNCLDPWLKLSATCPECKGGVEREQ